jgi:urea transport system ATP-binding protein
MAIVMVEQYLDFAHALGDHFTVMDRGAVVYTAARADMNETELRRCMAL